MTIENPDAFGQILDESSLDVSSESVHQSNEHSSNSKEWAETEAIESTIALGDELADDGEGEQAETVTTTDDLGRAVRLPKKKRPPKYDAEEFKLRGRRELCKRIAEIAPSMSKLVKLRLLGSYLDSTKNKEDEELTLIIKKDALKLAERTRIMGAILNADGNYAQNQLKVMIVNLLLQQETHELPEHQLDEKVIEFEKAMVKKSKNIDLAAMKKADPDRWHHFDTYRIVLEAAWSDNDQISNDEARLLSVLRKHLGISHEDHWLIAAMLKRFPKAKCVLHTPEEINEVRKDLHRQGVVWSYGSDASPRIDIVPFEIATVLRADFSACELQVVNYRRLMSHDSILASEIRETLQRNEHDRSGAKADLIERIVTVGVKPSEFLGELDKEKLSSICNGFALKTSGSKSEIIQRIIDFYDDLTFEPRTSKDLREVWYSNYELLASRAYAELRAKKVISKDLEIEHYFEDATGFLFEKRLLVPCDMSRKDTRSDGRLQLDGNQCLLWDCKSAEAAVNLQDHLDSQFDGYLQKERDVGKQPLAFIVIAPSFTPLSIKLAYQYKARTNWDISLVQADALKHLADSWFNISNGQPFPIRLLNRTEIIDKERAEYILSLA